MESEARQELPSRDLLRKNADLLLARSVEQVLEYEDAEVRAATGRLDLVVVAKEVQLEGDSLRVGFVWELKAPQCEVFVPVKDATYYKASPDLVEAENQLLHYHDDLSTSESLRRQLGLEGCEIRFGGLVVGKEATSFRCREGQDRGKSRRQARIARRLREVRFYRQNEIELLTWDSVLVRAQTIFATAQRKVGSQTIDPSRSPTSTTHMESQTMTIRPEDI